MFGWLKESRRIGTRYDKLARSLLQWSRWLARCGAYGSTFRTEPKRNGDFQVLRLTVKKRMRATLLAVRDEPQCRRHEPVRAQGSIGWLAAISTTTRCRVTCSALTVFGQLSAAYGGKPLSGAASVTGSSGHSDLCGGGR
jgi:hypothetical protein